jgi:phospholipid/cholesterol/gamma-HCH transport system substrate-binding protein
METRANNILVGAFVLVIFAIAALFSIWVSRIGEQGPRKQFFVVFSGSVQGLSVGGSVLFNGLRVGEVRDIRINPGNRSEIRALIAVDDLTPVKRNTRVRLTYQGLTGVAAIELSGGTEQVGDLTPGPDGVPPAMFAERSFVQNIIEGGTDTLGRVNAVVARIEDLVVANERAVAASIQNVRQFTDALAQNSQAVSSLLADASIASRRVADLSARLEQMANAIDPQRLAETVDGVSTVVSTIAGERERIAAIIADTARATRTAAEAADRLGPALERVAAVAQALDPAVVSRTLDGIDRSARNVAALTDAIDRNRIAATIENLEAISAAIAAERGNIANVVTDTGRAARAIADTAERLQPTVRRLDDLVAAVDPRVVQRSLEGIDRSIRDFERFDRVGAMVREANELVASLRNSARAIEGFAGNASGQGGVIGEITSTAQAIREAAQNLDRRIAGVTGSLSRFTDSGLRDLQALLVEGRRTISNVDRVMRDVERNPQQFLFGRSGVPEFRR